MHILDTESFSNTFGGKAQRKKPKVNISSLEEMVEKVDDSTGKQKPALYIYQVKTPLDD
jgi:nuclear GTP-binding protein